MTNMRIRVAIVVFFGVVLFPFTLFFAFVNWMCDGKNPFMSWPRHWKRCWTGVEKELI